MGTLPWLAFGYWIFEDFVGVEDDAVTDANSPDIGATSSTGAVFGEVVAARVDAA